MSILAANGAMACAECGRQARAVRDRLKAENDKLRDENARLRSCLSDDADNARQIMDENAKLRELVRDMWRDYKWATDDLEEPYSKQGEFAARMRELGIEVVE